MDNRLDSKRVALPLCARATAKIAADLRPFSPQSVCNLRAQSGDRLGRPWTTESQRHGRASYLWNQAAFIVLCRYMQLSFTFTLRYWVLLLVQWARGMLTCSEVCACVRVFQSLSCCYPAVGEETLQLHFLVPPAESVVLRRTGRVSRVKLLSHY